MEKQIVCGNCGTQFVDALIQCVSCGRPHDPFGVRVDWPRLSDWEKKRYVEILEWEKAGSSRGVFGKLVDVLVAPVEWAADAIVPVVAQNAIIKALEESLRVLQDAGTWTARHEAVMHDMVDGLKISSWTDGRSKDLQELDRIALSYADTHKLLALAEGAGTGFGGFAFAVADIPALMTITFRLLSQFSILHGHDPREDGEKVFMLFALRLGGDMEDQQAKVIALRELNVILQKALKDWTWRGLDKHVLVRLLKEVCKWLGIRLTKRKLAQMIPVLGAGVGAGVNYVFLRDVALCARNIHGKRFLLEKYGLPGQEGAPSGSSGRGATAGSRVRTMKPAGR